MIGAHISTAPRPQKEADILFAAGYNVTVCGVWYDPEMVERDKQLLSEKKWKFVPAIDFRPTSISNKLLNVWVRARRKLAFILYSKAGFRMPELLGYGSRYLNKYAKSFPAELVIAHSESTMWVAKNISESGRKVGIDYEDWFSEDLLPDSTKHRPIKWLKELEHHLAKNAVYRLTTSHTLAKALAEEYKVTPPSVVYNIFENETDGEESNDTDRLNRDNISLHWFSQTIGKGRGLELLFNSLPYLNGNYEVHLRGVISDEMKKYFLNPLTEEIRKNVYFHDIVSGTDLPRRIREHDIGLALENMTPKSRDLTVTNKLFQYLEAGLATIATSTKGQCEVYRLTGESFVMLPENNHILLANELNKMICDPNYLASMKQKAYDSYRKYCRWEDHVETIKSAAYNAMKVSL